MKRIKGFLGLLLGAVMLFSTCFFTACGAKGSGLNETADKTVAALAKQKTESLQVDINYGTFNGPEQTSQTNIKGQANLSDGDADILVKGSVPTESGEETYNYAVIMRDWHALLGQAEENSTDFSDYVFTEDFPTKLYPLYSDPEEFYRSYLTFIQAGMEIFGYQIGGESFEEDVATAFSLVNAEIISLADAAGGVTDKNGTLTVDLNKAAYGLFNDCKTFLNSLSEKTTIADLLKNEIVTKYMNSMLRSAKPETMRTKLLEVLNMFSDGNEGSLDATLLLKIGKVLSLQPDKGSTGYEYLVKMISSKEFKELMDYAGAEDFDLNKALGESFAEWVEGTMNTLNAFNVSETEIYYGDYTKITQAALVYELNKDYTIASMNAKATVRMGEQSSARTLTVDANVSFSSEKVALQDTDSLQAKYIERYHLEDGASKEGVSLELFSGSAGENYEEDRLVCYPVFANNKIVDFEVKGYQSINQGEENEVAIESVYDAETNTLTVRLGGEEYVFAVEIVAYHSYCYVYICNSRSSVGYYFADPVYATGTATDYLNCLPRELIGKAS